MKTILTFLLFIIILSACSKQDEEKYPGVIKGKVILTTSYYSSLDSLPSHEGVQVTLSDNFDFSKTILSDNFGHYEFSNVKKGDYKLRFEKENFTYYEIYNIQHNGLDTLKNCSNKDRGSKIKLEQYQDTYYKTMGDPFISSYKGGIPSGPNQNKFGLNFDIRTRIYSFKDYRIIAYISDEETVSDTNYKQVIETSISGRVGIPFNSIPIKFHELDNSLFPRSSTIYMCFYPYEHYEYPEYDPWLGIYKYFLIYRHLGQTVSFTLPGEDKYYDGEVLE